MEDVDEDVAVVDDDPLAGGKAVSSLGAHLVVVLEFFLNAVGDSLDLRLGLGGEDDEEIRHGGDAAQVDDDRVEGFFIEGDFATEFGEGESGRFFHKFNDRGAFVQYTRQRERLRDD